MADGKLVFPVRFDLEAAVKEASGDADRVLKRLGTMINSRPLKLGIEIEQPKGGWDKKLGDYGKGSITAMRKEMAKLVEQWNKLSEAQRITDQKSGAFTADAMKIINRYSQLVTASESYARSLEQIAAAAKKSADAEIRANQKAQAELEKRVARSQQTVAMLKAEETSLSAVAAKMKFYQQIADKSDFGSKSFLYATQQVERLGAQYQRLQNIMTSATGNKGKDIFNTEQLKQTLRGAESTIEQVKAKLKAVEQILAKTPQDSFGFRRASEEGERLLRLLKKMEANTPKAQMKAQEQLQREWLAAKDQREREREKETQQAIANANRENQARQAAYNAQRQAGLERQRILNAEENSIAAVTAKLQLQRQRLDESKVGSVKYERISEEVDRLTRKLNLMREALDAAGKRVEALRALREILAASEKTISGLTGKLQVYQERLKGLEVGSQKFNKTALEVRRLTDELERANQRMRDFQQTAFKGLGNVITEQQVARLTNLRNEIRDIDAQLHELQQQKANNAGKWAGPMDEQIVNNLLKQRMGYTRQINEMLKTGADLQLEREKEINREIEKRKAKQKEITDAFAKNRKILAAEENTIKNITAKLQLQKSRLESTNLDSNKFTRIAKEVERLTKKLDEARKKMAELTGQSTSGTGTQARNARKVSEEYSKQLTYLDRLVRRMAVYGSIGMIGGFLRNVREVTAQFELQRVSLGAILQDQTKANQLFSEIKGFALKSPVSILDLTKYTKQLAAYKIGYDELFETTKKLTDVSVGLGVSMDRVVLAYGQVRATGHLRASEIRQFTEMGVPIVEELAAKLSKMNGELVTAADVMDMVSKRAIGFDMVKEVFDDMTSAGGIFYNMQEKQGNTLYGLWAKLGDAASVMYDEIGRTGAVNATMKGLIQSATDLMKNWRLVAGEIAVATLGFGAYKIILNLTRVSIDASTKATQRLMAAKAQLTAAQNKLTAAKRLGNKAAIQSAETSILEAQWAVKAATANRLAANATNVWTAAKYRLIAAAHQLKAAVAGNWVMLLVTAMVAIGVAIAAAVEKATRLKRALNDIEAETINLQNQSVGRFEHLAEAAVNAADGSKKQRDALAELSRTYGDILPQDALKLENLRKMNHSYGELTATLREYIATQQMQKGLNEISSEYGDKINAASKKAIDSLVDYLKIEKDVAINIVGELQREVQENLEKGIFDYRTAGQRLKDIAGKFGVDISDSLAQSLTTTPWRDNWYDHLGLGKATNEFVALTDAIAGQFGELDEWHKRVEASTGAVGEWSKEIENTKKKIDELTLTNTDGSPINENALLGQQIKANETMKVVADLIKSDTSIRDAIKDKETEWQEDWIHLVSSVDPDNLMDITTINFDAIIKAFNAKYPPLADKIRQIQKEWGNIAPTDPTAIQIRQKLLDVSDSFGVSIDKMKKYLWDGSGSVDDYLKRLKEQQEELEALLKKKMETLENWSIIDFIFSGKTKDQLQKEIDETKQKLGIIKELYPFVEGYTVQKEKKNGGRQSDTRLQTLREIEETLTKINQKYEELLKKEGKAQALADIRKIYGDTLDYINKLGKQFGLAFEMPTAFKTLQDYRKAILNVIETLKMKGYEKAALELQTKIDTGDVDKLQKQIEVQLKKLSEKISRTKTAREFYDKILSQTGDIELAAQMSMSIYGDDGFELQRQLVEQIKSYLQNDQISIEIPVDVITTGNQINYKRLGEFAEQIKDEIGEKPYEALKKIAEQGQKDLAKTYEGYFKDLEKAKTYADKRVELARTTAEKIRKINADIAAGNIPEEDGRKTIRGLIDKEANEAAKLEYEAFKETPLYVQMFEDLEHASTTTLKTMRERLLALSKTWGSALDPAQLKEMQSRMNEITERLRQRNPFKALKEAYLDYKNSMKDLTVKGAVEKSGEAATRVYEDTRDYGADSKQAMAAERELRVREKILGITRSLTDENGRQLKGQKALDKAQIKANDNLKIARGLLDQAVEEQQEAIDKAVKEGKDPATDPAVKAANMRVEAAKEEVEVAQDVANIVQETAQTSMTLKAALEKAAQVVGQMLGWAGDIARGVADISEALGADEEDVQYWNTVADSLSNISAGIQDIVNSAMSGDIFGMVSSVLTAIPKMFVGFVNLFSAGKIRKANKEIKRQQELLEQLEYTFSRLEKVADKLFGRDYINNYNQQLSNLQAQAAAYQKQAEAEKSKGKKTDKEKLKEYENSYRDTMDEIADMQTQLVEKFTGTNRQDVARQMAQSWIDARVSMSDTFAAIKGDYSEMIKNLLVEGAAARVIENALTPMWDKMEKALEKNDIEGAIDSIIGEMDNALNAANNGMEVLWKALEARGYDMKQLIGDTARSDN
ncbi:MAG: hypothetical protein K2H46_00470 [Muribaculaceae bacterium]|nr:hypothetical protein [Muribaculaceae bacterium]